MTVVDNPVSEVHSSRTARNRHFRAYGAELCSNFSLGLTSRDNSEPAIAQVQFIADDGRAFARLATECASNQELQRECLPNGDIYLRWRGVFEFLVSADGRRVLCHNLHPESHNGFETYLLGPVVSYALLKQGVEQLHSTILAIGGVAVGLLGDTGYGKSTLAAEFVRVGFTLLTDDLLVIGRRNGRFHAFPGPACLKLFPDTAAAVLGEQAVKSARGKLGPKLIIGVGEATPHSCSLPLAAFYSLSRPSPHCSHAMRVQRLSNRRAFLHLVRNTYNTYIDDPHRLASQFKLYTEIASEVPLKLVSYPRHLPSLPLVRRAILDDLGRHTGEMNGRG